MNPVIVAALSRYDNLSSWRMRNIAYAVRDGLLKPDLSELDRACLIVEREAVLCAYDNRNGPESTDALRRELGL